MAAPGPVLVALTSCLQTVLPIPVGLCQTAGHGGDRGTFDLAQHGHLLSSRVLCSTLSVRTFTFSEALRGRRGVMRLTAAVLRKRLARPRVGELSQPGRGRGSAPPKARACMGRCSRKEARGNSVLWTRPTGVPLILWGGDLPGEKALASWRGDGPERYPCPYDKGETPGAVPRLSLMCTWAAAGVGSSSSSRSSMVATCSSSGSITMLALAARSSGEMEGQGPCPPCLASPWTSKAPF